ncbi:MAG: hypothetical protein LQ341_003864 [Variospora aurantia]|nr:MAG: hypothetical protein LQ341_003864 [Variospora aurantia]
MSILFYKKPDYRPKGEGPLNLQKCQEYVERTKDSKGDIPPDLSFEQIISNKALPDFLDYLAYVTNDAENLQFYLWLVDYHQRFRNAPLKETALSPKWNFDNPCSSPRQSDNSSHSDLGYSDKTLSVLGVEDFDAMEEEDISNASTVDGHPSPYTTTRGTLKFSEKSLMECKALDGSYRRSNDAQPFRMEIDHIVAHYIALGSPRELNLSHEDRAAVLYALRRTTHPSAFQPIKTVLDLTLRNQTHPNFVRWSICNGNKPWTIFLRTFAVCNIVVGFVIAILLTLSRASRWYRILAALEWWFGITTLITAYQGLCVLLLRRHTREVRPWEMDDEYGHRHGCDDEEVGLRYSKIVYQETKSRWPVKMELFGPPNTSENETWMDRYGMKSVFRRTFEKEVPTKDQGLHMMQNKIVRQAEAWAFIITVSLTVSDDLACGTLMASSAMVSGSPAGPGRAQGRARPTPGQLQTGDTHTRHQRFSWQDTPQEVQRSTFQQFSSPSNSTIDESPIISPPDGYQNFHAHHQDLAVPGHTAVQAPVERTGSPYVLPAPTETHPAYFAPMVEQTQLAQSELRQPIATDIKATPEDLKPSRDTPTPKPISHVQKESALVLKPDSDGSTLVYSPNSLAGPNAALDNHRPGQVAHPNAAVEPDWKHGLCEVDTLCCIGLCCPCILYGRTQYRITRKTQKEDPTNLLGYESCNGSCGLMSLACGFQCGLKTYKAGAKV